MIWTIIWVAVATLIFLLLLNWGSGTTRKFGGVLLAIAALYWAVVRLVFIHFHFFLWRHLGISGYLLVLLLAGGCFASAYVLKRNPKFLGWAAVFVAVLAPFTDLAFAWSGVIFTVFLFMLALGLLSNKRLLAGLLVLLLFALVGFITATRDYDRYDWWPWDWNPFAAHADGEDVCPVVDGQPDSVLQLPDHDLAKDYHMRSLGGGKCESLVPDEDESESPDGSTEASCPDNQLQVNDGEEYSHMYDLADPDQLQEALAFLSSHYKELYYVAREYDVSLRNDEVPSESSEPWLVTKIGPGKLCLSNYGRDILDRLTDAFKEDGASPAYGK